MAFALKVLEPGASLDVTIASCIQMFASESSGYTATSAAATYSATNHTWTLTGNAASTTMSLNYATTKAYAASKQVEFRSDITIGSTGLTSVALVVVGSTSGSVTVATQASPVNGTTYALHGKATLTGLVGNLTLKIVVTDPTSCNGKSVVLKNWFAKDLTVDIGAGYEPTSDAWEAWLQWRGRGMEWWDFYDATHGDLYYKLVLAPAHGLTTGDHINASSGYSIEWSTVVVVDANLFMVAFYEMYTPMSTWRAVDRTDKVVAKSIRANLRGDIDAEVSFECWGTPTWQPRVGMTVQMWDGTTLLQTAKIQTINRTPLDPNSRWRCEVKCMPIACMANRTVYLTELEPLDFLTSKAAVKKLWDGHKDWTDSEGSHAYGGLRGSGILWGAVDLGLADVGEVGNLEIDTTKALLDALATQSGKRWYVDNDWRLCFRDVIATATDAAHDIVDGVAGGNCQNPTLSEDLDGYASVVHAYSDVTSASYGDSLARQDEISLIEGNDSTYARLLRIKDADTYDELLAAAMAQSARYGRVVPTRLEFDSSDTDWRPNTKLTVLMRNLGMYGATMTNTLAEGDFDSTSGWAAYYGTHAVSGNELSHTGDGSASFSVERHTVTGLADPGRVFYVSGQFRVTNANCNNLIAWFTKGGGTNVELFRVTSPAANTWYSFAVLGVIPVDYVSGDFALDIYAYYASAAVQNGKVMQLRYWVLDDLTTDSGSGLEPTAAEMSAAALLNDPTYGFWNGSEYMQVPKAQTFNIDSVSIEDADGVNLRTHVSATSRDPDNYAEAPDAGSSSYISELQTVAQNSIGALKEEKGSFFPELAGTGTAGTWEFSEQTGEFSRLGYRVDFFIRLVPSVIGGSPTGSLQVKSLPFTVSATPAGQFAAAFVKGVNWGTNMTQVNLALDATATTGVLYGSYSNGTWAAVPVANVTVGDEIRIQGFYWITP